MTASRPESKTTEDVVIEYESVRFYLRRFRRVTSTVKGQKFAMDYVVWSPDDPENDLTRNVSRQETLVSELLSAMPPEDSANLIQAAQWDFKEALEPYYESWLRQNAFVDQPAVKPLRPIADANIVSAQAAGVIAMTLNIRHIEELAEVSDADCNACPVPNMRMIRQKARLFLSKTEIEPIAAEAGGRSENNNSEEIELLKAQIAELTALMTGSDVPQRADPERRGSGRPRKSDLADAA